MAINSNPSPGNADALISRIANALLVAYRTRLRSIYLLGSRASGTNLVTSDIDLGLIFSGSFSLGQRNEIWDFVKAIADKDSLMVDLVLLDEYDLRKGVRPYAKNGKLIAGEDTLADCNLLPKEELVAHYAYSALYYVWLIRNKPNHLEFPIGYPDRNSEFMGYETRGIWVGRTEFRAGFNTLVNLGTSLAGYQLAALKSEFVASKMLILDRYQACFPADSWGEFLKELLYLGRIKYGGLIPVDSGDRARLSSLCRRMIDFENLFLDSCIKTISILSIPNSPELCARLGAYIMQLKTDSPEHISALELARRRLGGLESLPER
jgi:predicted nucleotidyltransferase